MKEDFPSVSVFVPCHNLGAYLDETIQSVLDQTYQDFEILIIDDGSTDPATCSLLENYVRPKTRVIRTENRGVQEARNLGIRESRGRYLSFLDADDLYEPRFLERTIAALETDPAAAFASCWLKTFGEKTFDWIPESCDFPLLLVEDTVCTAAPTRREALIAVGGFDAGMPMAGDEDWDLAMGLVAKGLRGTIVREFLFRYRIRPGSLSAGATSLQHHPTLMRYMIEKHRDSYLQHIQGALRILEQKTLDFERYRPVASPPLSEIQQNEIEYLNSHLQGVLRSRTWRASRPLRRSVSAFQRLLRGTGHRKAKPDLSIVLTCRGQGRALEETFRSVSHQVGPHDEIIIVDCGSTDPATFHALDGYRFSGVRVLRAHTTNLAEGRKLGIGYATAPLLLAMGADQTLEPGFMQRAKDVLNAHPAISFVSGGFRDADGMGFTWAPLSADFAGVLGCRRFAFPLVRREALLEIAGYDAALSPEEADWDLVIRLTQRRRGEFLPGLQVNYHLRRRHPLSGDAADGSLPAVVDRVFEKHRIAFEANALDVIWNHDAQKRRLQAFAWDPYNAVPDRESPQVQASAGPDPEIRSSASSFKGAILLYHRIASPERDRWQLAVSPRNFEAHLRILAEEFAPVRLPDLMSVVARNASKKPPIAVTFDDGYRDNWEVALPLLRAAEIPATFFLSGDGAELEGSFWWEVLDAVMEKMGLDETAASEMHARLRVLRPEERAGMFESLPSSQQTRLPPRMTLGEMAALAREPLAEIGAHTHSHLALGAVATEIQRQEIGKNIAMLSEIARGPIESFAYPFGGPYNDDTMAILRESGILRACTVAEAPVTPDSDPLALPRFQIGDWEGPLFRDLVRDLLEG